MRRKQATHQTKAQRARRGFWMRFGVWIFIVFFALSVGGGVMAIFWSHSQ
jgi:hypothetical protein